MELDSVIYTNPGGREHNEDSAGGKQLTEGGLFVLADGLGGHQFGELASNCAVSSFLDASEPDQDTDLSDWLVNQFEVANQKILQLQKEHNASMKSTAVALVIQGNRASWAHVGDSRLLYFHRGTVSEITEDHSVAYKKYKAGEITRAQIGQDEDQSALLRALGNTDRYQPDFKSLDHCLESGDGFLLCSDGVWEYLYDEEALVDLLKAETARQWAELLLLRVIDRVRAGNDNLSLITVLVL